MANVKISQLPSLSTMTDLAQIPVVASGTTYQITGANLQNYFGSAVRISNGTTEVNIGASGGNANISVGGTSNVAVFTTTGVTVAGNVTSGNVNTGVIALTNGATITNTVANAVAFGREAGLTSQGISAVAIGPSAGTTTQGVQAVALGVRAGQTTQGNNATAIGADAGYSGQSANATAVGGGSAQVSQGDAAVAVGHLAGQTSQGISAVAIGKLAGNTNQGNNSIILNATGAALDQTTANTFTVAPVRNDVANIGNVMFYNATSKEITYGNTISVAGNITGGNISTGSRVVTTPVAFSALTAVTGARAFVNDGNLVAVGNFGAQVSGGGANTVPVWSNGTNWYIG